MIKTASTFVTSVLASVALAEANKDGIWSGHKWVDNINGIKNTDGILSGVNTKMQQRFDSASIYKGDDIEENYLD